ncbi:RHS repeat protein, partial [Paludibacterium paludis]
VTLANGLTTTTSYDAAGRVVAEARQAAGVELGTTTYRYDALDRLYEEVDASGRWRRYLYDGRGRRVGEVDGAGSLTAYLYDALDRRIVSYRFATAVDAARLTGRPESWTLAALAPARHAGTDQIALDFYDAAGRRVRSVEVTGSTVEYRYDAVGREVARRAYANRVSPSYVLWTGGKVYEAMMQATALPVSDLAMHRWAVPGQNEANDRVERRFYDGDGQLTGVLDGEGGLTEYRYDAAGRQVATVRYATACAAALRATGSLAALRPAATAA